MVATAQCGSPIAQVSNGKLIFDMGNNRDMIYYDITMPFSFVSVSGSPSGPPRHEGGLNLLPSIELASLPGGGALAGRCGRKNAVGCKSGN